MEYIFKDPYKNRVAQMTEEQKSLFSDGDLLLVRDGMLFYVANTIPEPNIRHWYDRLLFWRKDL